MLKVESTEQLGALTPGVDFADAVHMRRFMQSKIIYHALYEICLRDSVGAGFRGTARLTCML